MIHLRQVLATALMAALVVGCSSETTFDMADDEPLVWEELRGDWVFVNYWAEWCKPCFEEIPELNELNQEENVTVLGVNFDGEQGEQLRDTMETMDIQFRVFQQDPGPGFDWRQPVALPATMVINPDGELVTAMFGEQTKEEFMEVMQ